MIRKKIKIPLYKTELNVLISDTWEPINIRYGLNVDDSTGAIMFRRQGSYFVGFSSTPHLGYIVHETVHVVNKIFEDRDVELCTENDEHQAYFTEWLFNEICKCMNIKTDYNGK